MKGGKHFVWRGNIAHPCNDYIAKKIAKRRANKKLAKASRKKNRN